MSGKLLGRQAYAVEYPVTEAGSGLRTGHDKRVGRFQTTLTCSPGAAEAVWVVSLAVHSSMGGFQPFASWTSQKRQQAAALAEALLDGVGAEAYTRVVPWKGGLRFLRRMTAEERAAACSRPVAIAS